MKQTGTPVVINDLLIQANYYEKGPLPLWNYQTKGDNESVY